MSGFEQKWQAYRAYRKRIQGIISPAFHSKAILTVGVGAGSYAVEKLARLSPQMLRNCDLDVVEFSNLSRTGYMYRDAEALRLKVDALHDRIKDINPFVHVEAQPKSILELSAEELDRLFEDIDLVVAGTDQFEAQAMINEQAVQRGIPVIFIGVHEAAKGGRVIWCIPGRTPCYRCIARERYQRAQQDRRDFAGMVGSIIDCQFIDMIATKVAVAVLEREQNSLMGQFYERLGLRNDIVVRCDPGYDWGNLVWDAILGDLPKEPKEFANEIRNSALYAMDSIWMVGEWDPSCTVCGGAPYQSEVGTTVGVKSHE